MCCHLVYKHTTRLGVVLDCVSAYELLSDRKHIWYQLVFFVANSPFMGMFEESSLKGGLNWSPLRVSFCCVEFWTGVALSIEIMLGILFSSIAIMCDDTSMTRSRPRILDINLCYDCGFGCFG